MSPARVAVAVSAVLLTALACSPPPGPAGRVVGKDRDWQPATKTYRYDLTVRTSDGDHVSFRASSTDYNHCYRGSAYPACTKRKDG